MQYGSTGEILAPCYNFTEDNLFITTAGYTNFSVLDGAFKEYRIHSYHSVNFVVNGEGVLYVANRKYKIEKGDFFLLPKNENIKYFPKDRDWEYYWFDFDGNKSEEYIKLMGFSKDSLVLKGGNLNDIIYLCESVISKKFKNENLGYYEVLSVFFNILDLIVKNKSNTYSSFDLKESIVKYIKLHYSRHALSVEEICKDFNISHSYLCKLFRNHGDLTAKGTIIKIRLKEAQKLLLNPNFSIKQIAHSVGFSDDAYFMKLFKKEFKVTPSEYRKNNLAVGELSDG